VSPGPELNPHPPEVPPGYPREYERDVRLRDGRRAFVRPIIPSDAEALAEAFRTADVDTLRRRFLGAPPPLTPDRLRRLTTVDYRLRFALVAGGEAGRGIGVARYETAGDGRAEAAVVVDPGWRRAGLATAMIELLAQAALERGIDTFTATYLAENRPVTALVNLARDTGERLIRQGIADIAVRLDRDRPSAADDGNGEHADDDEDKDGPRL
jgi:RimJ/RimL family protein N-acetyltransferase